MMQLNIPRIILFPILLLLGTALNTFAVHITVRDFNAVPGDGIDDTAAIHSAIAACQSGDRLIFEKGTYDLWNTIVIDNKTNIDVDGSGAILMLRGFNRSNGGPTFSAIHLLNSHKVTIHNFTVDMDVSPNSAGEIINVGSDFLDVQLFDEFPVTGDEFIDHIMTFHRDYRPNGRNLDSYMKFEVAKIAERVLRITVPNLRNVSPGEYLCMYHKVYGGNAIRYVNTNSCTLRDVTILSFAGMGFYATNRTTNLTVERYFVQRPEDTQRLTSTNADGSKFVLTGGILTIKDCYYEGMGDDAINIHSSYAKVTKIDINSAIIEIIGLRGRTGSPVPVKDHYVLAGDKIEFYDQTTMLPKGTAYVVKRDNHVLKLDALPQDVKKGDLFNNLSMCPVVRISNVTVNRNRARGFLLQSQDVIVEDCTITNPTGVGIFVTTDVAFWYESGPGNNVIIRNNTIDNANNHLIMEGAINVKCGHDKGGTDYPAGVHRNILIEGNTIRNTSQSAIYACSSDDIRITGNKIDQCSQEPVLPNGKHAIFIKNSSKVYVHDNDIQHAELDIGHENCMFADE